MQQITSKLFVYAAFVLLGIVISPIANAWTFYYSGTIDSGYDHLGVFGSPTDDLSGQSYSQLFTFDPSQYLNQNSGTDFIQGYGSLTGSLTDLVTIGGVSTTLTFDLTQYNWGSAVLVNDITQGYGGYDQAYLHQEGYLTNGSYLNTQFSLSSYINPFNLALSYNQYWSYTSQTGDDHFQTFSLNDGVNSTYFTGTTNFASINNTSPVPEPSTYAMFLAGLGLFGFMPRRKQDFTA